MDRKFVNDDDWVIVFAYSVLNEEQGGTYFAGICIVAFQIFTGDIVRFFIDEPETLSLGTEFLRIACLATPLMVTNVQMNYTFQAMGKGKQSLLLSSCRQGLVNIPLLYLLNYYMLYNSGSSRV